MQGLVNDLLRAAIALLILLLGRLLQVVERFRISTFTQNQQRLRRRYKISTETPIIGFNAQLEDSIFRTAQHFGNRSFFAFTSGSTGKPKRLLYTKRRLRNLRFQFVDVFARACCALGIRRTSLYVFSSFDNDQSVTGLLMSETKLPGYFSTLQAPYRVQCDLSIRELIDDYGPAAVRLWVLTISNPGVLYSTNPSTISTFLDEISDNWERSRQLVKDWCERPFTFNERLHFIARRIESRGSKTRLAKIAESDSALTLQTIAPGTKTYICWTGGYVAPFLDRLDQQLPPNLYRRLPMYSMSTEVVETVTCFRGREPKFLPIARGVLYEFLRDGDADLPENILEPTELVAGESYTMVVSDEFGLRRYQTNDLFRCEQIVNGLPGLTFTRRRGLEYSFSGEKLTAEQLCEVYQDLSSNHAGDFGETFFTCVPALSRNVPHYLILAVGDSDSMMDYSKKCDELLCEINLEYRNKRVTGRLGSAQFERISVEEFAGRHSQWDSQFKILPMYQDLWTF